MTYLELCRQLRLECGIPGTGPTGVADPASDEMLRLISWINQAYLDIQMMPNCVWEWLRKPVSFNTTATKGNYTVAETGLTDFAKWKDDSFRVYLTSAGVGSETLIDQMPYNAFRDYYLFNTRQTSYSRPISAAVGPDKSICLGLAPDDVYTVRGEYWSSPQVLEADGDTPELPERFHMAIVYKALISYGVYEESSAVIARGEKLYGAYLNMLLADQQGDITLAGGLI